MGESSNSDTSLRISFVQHHLELPERLVVSQFERFNHKGTKSTKKTREEKSCFELALSLLSFPLLGVLCAFVVKSVKLRHYQTVSSHGNSEADLIFCS